MDKKLFNLIKKSFKETFKEHLLKNFKGEASFNFNQETSEFGDYFRISVSFFNFFSDSDYYEDFVDNFIDKINENEDCESFTEIFENGFIEKLYSSEVDLKDNFIFRHKSSNDKYILIDLRNFLDKDDYEYDVSANLEIRLYIDFDNNKLNNYIDEIILSNLNSELVLFQNNVKEILKNSNKQKSKELVLKMLKNNEIFDDFLNQNFKDNLKKELNEEIKAKKTRIKKI